MSTSDAISRALDEVVAKRQQEVAAATNAKRKAAEPLNPNNYRSLDEFTTETGTNSLAVQEHFIKRRNARILDEQVKSVAAIKQRNTETATRWEENITFKGGAIDHGAAAMEGLNNFAGFVAQAPAATLGAVQGMTVSSENQDLFNRATSNPVRRDKLNAERLRVQKLLGAGTLAPEEGAEANQAIDAEFATIKDLTSEENASLDARSRQFFRRWATGDSSREVLTASQENADTADGITAAFANSPMSRLAQDGVKAPLNDAWDITYDENLSSFTAASEAMKSDDYDMAIFETAKGVTGLLAGATADALDNPQAAFSWIAENAAPLVAGVVSKAIMATMNVGYGIDIYSKALEEYKEKNDGADPGKGEKLMMIAVALSAVIPEYASNLRILRKIDDLPGATDASREAARKAVDKVRSASDKVGDTASAAASDVAEKATQLQPSTGLRKVVEDTASGAKDIAETIAFESVTEGWQTAVEENFSKLNTDVDGRNIFHAMAAGGTSAGGMRSMGYATNALVGTAEIATSRADGDTSPNAKRDGRQQALYEAVEAGKVDAADLEDVSSENYSPDTAVRRYAATAFNKAATEEERTAAKDSIEQISKTVAVDRIKLEQARDQHQKEKTEGLSEAELESHTKEGNDLLEEFRDNTYARDTITKFKEALAAENNPTPESIDVLIEAATGVENTPESATAASDVVTLLMQSPGAVSDEQLEALQASKNLSTEQREYVELYSQAHAEINKLRETKQVTEDVLYGRDGFRGITGYVSAVTTALREGDTEAANKEISDLLTFTKAHIAKGVAIKTAADMAMKLKKRIYAIPDATAETGWVFVDKDNLPANYNQGRMGAWETTNNVKHQTAAEKALVAIKAEVVALQASGKELQAAYKLTSGEAATAAAVAPVVAANPQTKPATPAPVAVKPAEAKVAPVVAKSGAVVKGQMTPESVSQSPDSLFVFGDNLAGWGKKGQAVIRGAKNAFGIPTKRKPATTPDAYFSDQPDEIAAVQAAMDNLKGKTFLLPEDGIGTGLAQLKERSPKIAGMLHSFFQENVEGYNNSLAPKPVPPVVAPTTKPARKPSSSPLKKIISGGQTGGDLGGLVAGERLGLETGGTAPKGFKTDAGPKPDELKKYGVTEDSDSSYVPRTKKNVDNSDGTVAFIDSSIKSVGTSRTVGYAQTGNWVSANTSSDTGRKPVLVIDPKADFAESVKQLRDFIKRNNIATLNVAGHRERSAPGLAAYVAKVIEAAYQDEVVEAKTETKPEAKTEAPSSEQSTSEVAPADANATPAPAVTQEAPAPTPDPAEAAPDGAAVEGQTGGETETNTESTTETEPEIAEESGVLDFTDPDAPNLENNLGDWFSQKTAGKKAKSANPLVAIKDFMKHLFKDGELQKSLVEKYLKDDAELTPEGIKALLLFQRFNTKFAEHFARNNNNLKFANAPLWRHRNYIKFFKNDIVPDNVITAMAAAAFTWAGENGDKLINSFGDMRILLGLDSNAQLGPEQINLLLNAGFRRNSVIQDLGKRVATALNMRADPDGPMNFQAQFELAVGTHALYVLMDMGMVDNHVIHSAALNGNEDGGEGDMEVDVDIAPNFDTVIELGDEHLHDEKQKVEAQLVAAEKAGKSPAQLKQLRISLTAAAVTANKKFRKMLTAESFNNAHPFIRLVKAPVQAGEAETAIPATQLIVETNRESGAILNNLFAIDSSDTPPTTVAGKHEQTVIRNSRQTIASVWTAAAEKVSSYRQSLRDDIKSAREAFSDDNVGRMAGKVEVEENGINGVFTHIAQIKSAEAKNAGIDRGMQRLKEFEGFLTKPFFYLRYLSWSNQRAGQTSSMINTQTDKFQRHSISMPAWETEINPVLEQEDGTTDDEHLKGFLLAVAQNFGIAVDTTYHEGALRELKDLMESSAGQDVMEIMYNRSQLAAGEKLSDEDQKIVVDFVRERGEAWASFDALVSYVDYTIAKGKKKTYTSKMMFEVDGVNNGPAFVNILLGSMEASMGAMAGFFNANDGHTSYASYKSTPGNMDMYERLAAKIQTEVERIIQNGSPAMAAILNINGQLVKDDKTISRPGRKLAKGAMTPIVFGSGTNKTISNMAADFEQKFYSKLAEAAMDNDIEQIAFLVNELNKLLPYDKKAPNKGKLPIPGETNLGADMRFEAMLLELTFKQRRALSNTFTNTAGVAIKAAVKADLKAFTKTRQNMNDMATAGWERYNQVFEALKEAELDRLMANGTIPSDNPPKGQKRRRPRRDLNGTELARLEYSIRDLAPIVHTVMSLESGDLGSGVNVGKTTQTSVDPNDPIYGTMYSQEVPKGVKVSPEEAQADPSKRNPREYNMGDPARSPRRNWISGMGSSAKRWVNSEPGVRAVILLTHALDSAIATRVYAAFEALNVHDAIGFGVKDVVPGARALNKATFEILSSYSIPRELNAMLERSFAAEERLLKEHPQAALIKSILDVVTVGRGKTYQIVNNGFKRRAQRNSLQADLGRVRFLLQVTNVNQYAHEGGHYEVTEEDRSNLAAQEATLVAQLEALSAEDAEAAAEIDREIKNKAKAKSEVPAVVETPTPNRAPPKETPWGLAGESGVIHDDSLVALLSDPNQTTDSIMSGLNELLKTGSGLQNAFQRRLLHALKQAVGARDLKIVMVTPDTAPIRESVKMVTAAGAYMMSKNGDTIYIKGPGFVDAHVTAEVLLHELTHAATARVVAAFKGKKLPAKATERQKAAHHAVQELDKLHEKALQYVIDNYNLHKRFGAAVANLDEMIAWGMTNTAFQQEVLSKIDMPVTDQTQKALEAIKETRSGLQSFIRSLTALFFGQTDTKQYSSQQNGMGVLIANTGLLFDRGADNLANSGRGNTVFNMENTNPAAFTSAEIFEALGQTDTLNAPLPAVVAQRLQKLLVQVTDAVYGPTGVLRAAASRAAPVTADAVYFDALKNKEVPFASKLQPNLVMTAQESFVAESLERTLREVFTAAPLVDARVYARRKALDRLWLQAKAKLNPEDLYTGPGDWASASKEDRAPAERAYNVIFTAQRGGDQQSDYLSQFAAAAMTYQPLFNALTKLKTPADPQYADANTFAGKIDVMIKQLTNRIIRAVAGSRSNEQMANAVFKLARGLATSERKRAREVAQKAGTTEHRLAKAAREKTDKVRGGIESAANYAYKSRYKPVRALAGVTAAIAGNRGEQLVVNTAKLFRGAAETRNTFAESVVNEARNGRAQLIPANDMLGRVGRMEKERVEAILATRLLIEESFANKLTKEESGALTKILIRTDMSKLLGDHYNMAELESLIRDPAALDAAIAAFEAQLTGPHKDYYSTSAEALGYYMATGHATVENLMMNAGNIAYLGNTLRKAGDAAEMARREQAAEIIDPLISLYALKWSSNDAKKSAAAVMKTEAQRTDKGNGAQVALIHHKGLQEQARNRLFDGRTISMVKGYSKDIYDPKVTIVSATPDEAKKLIKAGYRELTEDNLQSDPRDTSPEGSKLYYIEFGGLRPIVPGFMSNDNKRSKGHKVKPGSRAEREALRAAKLQASEAMFAPKGQWSPDKVKENFMVPILNHDGDAINYRYTMRNATKDIVNKRENRIGHVLGATMGSMVGKTETPGLNQRGVDILRTQYDDEYFKTPNSFVEFSANSTDPEVAERYKMLPTETKRYIRKTFGRDGMKVHKDTYDIAFGYRKYSMAEMFEKDFSERNLLEKSLVGALSRIWVKRDGKWVRLGDKAAAYIVAAEDVWQATVKFIKDVRVIRNVVTFIGNETSNMSLLKIRGVSFADIARDKAIGIEATLSYIKDLRERERLQMLVDFKHIDGVELVAAERRVIELDTALESNPVRVLVDADMFQTLVEDISVEMDSFSYKSSMDEWVDARTAWVNPSIKRGAKTLLMSPGTPLYDFMYQSTVLSDFTSRYVLYKHLTTRQENKLAPAEAIHDVRQAFVNYDVPTHKGLQYANDMGLLWFTKYYVRIQAVIFQMARENPLQALMLLAANGLYEFPDVFDSSMLSNSPLNFGSGALELGGSFDDIATIRALLAPFR